MLTLYVKTGCPFCARVREVIEELGIQEQVQEKNISDEAVVAELIERGGKRQVPYLIDTQMGEAMYESEDIANHLKEHYGASA